MWVRMWRVGFKEKEIPESGRSNSLYDRGLVMMKWILHIVVIGRAKAADNLIKTCD